MFVQKMGYFIHVLVLKCMVRAFGYGGKDTSVPQGMYDSHAAGSRCASDIGGIHAVCLKTLYQDIPVAVISHMAGHISGNA